MPIDLNSPIPPEAQAERQLNADPIAASADADVRAALFNFHGPQKARSMIVQAVGRVAENTKVAFGPRPANASSGQTQAPAGIVPSANPQATALQFEQMPPAEQLARAERELEADPFHLSAAARTVLVGKYGETEFRRRRTNAGYAIGHETRVSFQSSGPDSTIVHVAEKKR